MSYGYSKQVDLSFSEADKKVRGELQKEGFGVLTEIDVRKILKEKLDVDYEDYIILGACNPPFAHKALEAEKEIGLLLPCNVIVYRKKNRTFVSAINPMEAMGMVDNPELQKIAGEVGEKLREVIDAI
jgi:uncharacterized protein (DUF302 family)